MHFVSAVGGATGSVYYEQFGQGLLVKLYKINSSEFTFKFQNTQLLLSVSQSCIILYFAHIAIAGFMLNLVPVLLELCMPFCGVGDLGRLAKVDPSYATSPACRLNYDLETCLAGAQIGQFVALGCRCSKLFQKKHKDVYRGVLVRENSLEILLTNYDKQLEIIFVSYSLLLL